jgi:hypothetical protein
MCDACVHPASDWVCAIFVHRLTGCVCILLLLPAWMVVVATQFIGCIWSQQTAAIKCFS